MPKINKKNCFSSNNVLLFLRKLNILKIIQIFAHLMKGTIL